MLLSRRQIKAFAGLAAFAFLVAVTASSEAGRRYHGSFGSSGGSSGGYGSSGSHGSYGSSGGSSGGSYGSYGSYGSRGGLFRRRALRRGSHGSSGGYYHSSGGSAYGSSGGAYGSSGGYSHGSYGSSGGYSHGSYGSSGGVIIHQAPAVIRRRPPIASPPAKAPTPPQKAPAPQAPKPAPKKKENQARMTIQVPADAIVSLNNQQMKLTGQRRKFISPVLPSDNAYTYSIQVEVVRDGKLVTIQRNQIVRAGGNYELTFIEQNGKLVFVGPVTGNVVAIH